MKIGFMGLGKLGLPCALAIEQAGHEVVGYDPGTQVIDIMSSKKLPYVEVGAQELLDKTNIRLVGVHDMVNDCDLIFVAVQTPHHSRYEGVSRMPTKRVDFDYKFLKAALNQISFCLELNQNNPTLQHKTEARVVIISTVLPGTIDSEIRPHLNSGVKLCYNPFFIAMGTTIYDFTHPEFVLFGVDDPGTAAMAEDFYKTIHNRPFYKTTIKNAELIKVAYNTYISTKLAFVNTLMEVCHKTGCDVDAVTDALKMANERLISPRYMTAGMGDGGGCHPRDNIALSWLARKLEMGFDFFEAIMLSRERQTDWFADLVEESYWARHGKLPIIIMGEAFKPETNLVTGSPALLLANVLRERGLDPKLWDPIVHPDETYVIKAPAVYFIGCKHEMFSKLMYPNGSTVIDPHRYIPDQGPDVEVIRLGEGEEKR
jgi:UDPglucose 6-dehydrogenase